MFERFDARYQVRLMEIEEDFEKVRVKVRDKLPELITPQRPKAVIADVDYLIAAGMRESGYNAIAEHGVFRQLPFTTPLESDIYKHPLFSSRPVNWIRINDEDRATGKNSFTIIYPAFDYECSVITPFIVKIIFSEYADKKRFIPNKKYEISSGIEDIAREMFPGSVN